MLTLARRLAWAAAIGMLVVLLMGATVTKTGSAEGCGKSWPLCHGKFIPEYAFTTMVEFSHRLVTSLEGFLLLAACVAAFRFRRALPELKVLIPLTLFTLVLQSGMGAAAVMWPQMPTVLALHFGISLTALASVYLMARVLAEGPDRPPRDDAAVPAGFKRLMWSSLVVITVVAYLGAYVRHTHSQMACYTWPLCNGSLFPGFTGPVGIAFNHRLAALVAVLLLVWMLARARDLRAARPDLWRIAVAAVALVLVQSLVGGLVIVSRLSFAATMAHALTMALLFSAVADGARLVLPQPRPAERPRRAGDGSTVGAPAPAR